MTRGRTSKECPACKVKPDWRGRPTDGICGTCERKLKEYGELQVAAARRQAESMELVKLPDSWHRFPRFYMGLALRQNVSDGPRERLSRIIADLIREIADKFPLNGADDLAFDRSNGSVLTHEGWSIYGRGRKDGKPWDGTPELYLMRPVVAELFRNMYDAISESFEETYAKSVEQGQNVLLQLATGEMTVKQFNKATMDQE